MNSSSENFAGYYSSGGFAPTSPALAVDTVRADGDASPGCHIGVSPSFMDHQYNGALLLAAAEKRTANCCSGDTLLVAATELSNEDARIPSDHRQGLLEPYGRPRLDIKGYSQNQHQQQQSRSFVAHQSFVKRDTLGGLMGSRPQKLNSSSDRNVHLKPQHTLLYSSNAKSSNSISSPPANILFSDNGVDVERTTNVRRRPKKGEAGMMTNNFMISKDGPSFSSTSTNGKGGNRTSFSSGSCTSSSAQRRLLQDASASRCRAAGIAQSIDIVLIETRWKGLQCSHESIESAAACNLCGAMSESETQAVAKLAGIAGVIVNLDRKVLLMRVFGNVDCFILSFGCIVAWGATKAQMNELYSVLKPFTKNPLPVPEEDDMAYSCASPQLDPCSFSDALGVSGDGVLGQEVEMRIQVEGITDDSCVGIYPPGSSPVLSPTAAALKEEPLEENNKDSQTALACRPKQKSIIVNDTIHLASNNVLERLAYAYAFAQSVKLEVFEGAVDVAIAGTRSIPDNLVKYGAVKMSTKAVSKKMGELFVQRSNVNLHTDILDTPDIFWNYDAFERVYLYCRETLDIQKRLEILNQRLDIMKEMYEMLQNELNVEHGNKLEWIVIILICVEVMLQVLTMLVNYWSHGNL